MRGLKWRQPKASTTSPLWPWPLPGRLLSFQNTELMNRFEPEPDSIDGLCARAHYWCEGLNKADAPIDAYIAEGDAIVTALRRAKEAFFGELPDHANRWLADIERLLPYWRETLGRENKRAEKHGRK